MEGEASGPNSLKHAYLLMMIMMMNESCPTQLVNYMQTGLVSRTRPNIHSYLCLTWTFC